jgi:hypothetical protein
LPSPARRRTALLGAGLVGLAVALIASLAVLRVDCACEPDTLPVVGAPTDAAAILKTIAARREGDRLTLEYRSSTPVDDCAALAVEVPRVWALAVAPLVDAVPPRRVVIWVQNTYAPPVNGATARWVGMTFVRMPDRWASVAPCQIRIP